jgi:hypothetical protein
MPIWVHRLLGVIFQIAGAFGGAVAGWLVGCFLLMALAAGAREAGAGRVLSGLGNLLALIIGATCFFSGAWLGRVLVYGLFVRNVPARCPECGGRAYFRSEVNDKVRYRCRSCKYAYVGQSWQE